MWRGRRVFLFGGLILLVLLGGLGFLAARARLEEHAVERSRRWLGRVAAEHREAVKAWREENLRDLSLVALNPETARVIAGTGDREDVEELLAALTASHRYPRVAVLDSHGRRLVSSPSGGEGRWTESEGGVAMALEPGPGGGMRAIFRRAVPLPSRGPGGWVVLESDAGRELAARLAPPAGSPHVIRTTLLFPAGPKWMSLDPKGKTSPAPVALATIVQKPGPTKPHLRVTTVELAKGVPSLAAAVPVPGTRWWVVSAVGRRAVVASADAFARSMAAIAIALLIGLFGVVTAIRSRYLRQRAESLARYEALFESAPVALFEVNLSAVVRAIEKLKRGGVTSFRRHFQENPEEVRRLMGLVRVVAVNDGAVRLYGLDAKEELLAGPNPAMIGEAETHFAEWFISIAQGTPLFEAEIPIIPRTGQPRTGLVRIRNPRSPEEPEHVVVSIVDITTRRRMEQRLVASAKRLEEAERIAGIGNWEWDPRADRILLSGGLCRILGLGPSEGRLEGGEFFHRFIHGEDRKEVNEAERALIEEDRPYRLEYRVVSPTGSVRRVLDRAEVVRDENGAPILVRGTLLDVTMQRALEEQLRQAQKMEAIGRLAGGVAHDFNNILQALMMLTDGLRLAAGNGHQIDAVAEELDEQLERAATLTRQLLLFSRKETGKPESLDLNEVMLSMQRMLSRLVREDIRFSVTAAESPILIRADRSQLEQVLMNLVVNSVDAMPNGGSLRVRTVHRSEEPGWGCLEVIDTGCGIPEDALEHIFEPFFTTKDSDSGTGLGLSVVHGIVTSLGGRIEVESRVGAGTAFSIHLPLATGKKKKEPSDHHPAIPPPGGGERVLVVEDNPAVRESLQASLEALGYQVTAMESAEEAEALEGDPPDALLTDQVLPGMTGLELAKRSRDRWPNLPIILMSGYSEDEALKDLVGSGRVRFLQKPAPLAQLAAELRAALDEVAEP